VNPLVVSSAGRVIIVAGRFFFIAVLSKSCSLVLEREPLFLITAGRINRGGLRVLHPKYVRGLSRRVAADWVCGWSLSPSISMTTSFLLRVCCVGRKGRYCG
jgi:hypothetical protein